MNMVDCWVMGPGRIVVAFEHEGLRVNKWVRSKALAAGVPVNEEEEVANLTLQIIQCAKEAARDLGLK